MRYNPEDAVQCLPAGDYSAVIESADEKQSKSGRDMIEFVLRVYADANSGVMVKEYVVVPDFLWKLKKIAQAIGKIDAFNSGEFDPSDYIGESLTVELYIDEQDGFDPQNRVKRYKPLQRTLGGKKSGDNNGSRAYAGEVEDSEVPF